MKLSFAVLLAVANKWRGVRMDVFAARKVEELRNELLPARHVGGISSLTERGEPYGDLTGKLRLDRAPVPANIQEPAPANEPRESLVGRDVDSWRIAQAGNPDERGGCFQVLGSPSQAEVAGLANIPPEAHGLFSVR